MTLESHGLLQRGVDLQPYNTLNVAVVAENFAEITSTEQLVSLLGWHHQHTASLPILVLGGGSNLVLTQDYCGLVILNRIMGIELLDRTSDEVLVKVGAGQNWDDFIDYSLSQNWFGLENLSAIPGTVGAAPMQNIGAYGVELAELVERVDYLDRASGEQRSLTNQQCEFGYRSSIFKHQLKHQCIITAVVFRLPTSPRLNVHYGDIRKAITEQGLKLEAVSPQQLRQLVIDIRNKKLPDPEHLPNVGSFFKNPVVSDQDYQALLTKYPGLVSYGLGSGQRKLAAGWMIDQLGWKGKLHRTAKVHDRQALVLINLGDASDDLLALASAIQSDVEQHFGIWLEPEPSLI